MAGRCRLDESWQVSDKTQETGFGRGNLVRWANWQEIRGLDWLRKSRLRWAKNDKKSTWFVDEEIEVAGQQSRNPRVCWFLELRLSLWRKQEEIWANLEDFAWQSRILWCAASCCEFHDRMLNEDKTYFLLKKMSWIQLDAGCSSTWCGKTRISGWSHVLLGVM